MGKTLIFLNLLLIPIIIFSIWSKNETETINTAQRIELAGYTCETHTVWTPDGYGLTIFRIRNSTTKLDSPASQSSAQVVLMMHGLTSSSDVWVIRNHSHHLALELVDQGYDVWLGNSRGNTYGLQHLNYTIKDRKFWRFSWHELGTIDLPTTIDYILRETQQPTLHYVGHSQGTTIAMVMLSTLPEYNAKLKTSHFFAPIAFMTSSRSSNLRFLSKFLGSYSLLNNLLGDREIFEPPILRHLMGFEWCRTKKAYPPFCLFLSTRFFGGYSTYVKEYTYPELFNTHPSPASGHQALHFVQLHVSGKFRRYDFGSQGNMERYNQTIPPDYDLAKIQTRFPIHLYYSDSDDYSTKTDVEKLSGILGARCVTHFIDLEGFAHMDFTMAYNIESVVNQDVVRIINEAERHLTEDT